MTLPKFHPANILYYMVFAMQLLFLFWYLRIKAEKNLNKILKKIFLKPRLLTFQNLRSYRKGLYVAEKKYTFEVKSVCGIHSYTLCFFIIYVYPKSNVEADGSLFMQENAFRGGSRQTYRKQKSCMYKTFAVFIGY